MAEESILLKLKVPFDTLFYFRYFVFLMMWYLQKLYEYGTRRIHVFGDPPLGCVFTENLI